MTIEPNTVHPNAQKPQQSAELILGIDAELYANPQTDTQDQSLLKQLATYFKLIPVSKDNEHISATICGYIAATQAQKPDALLHLNALLPCEEWRRLLSPDQLAQFIIRVLAFDEWQQLQQRFAGTPITGKALIDIHSRYKYLVMAHSLEHYQSLGRLLGNLRGQDLNQVANEYFQRLMAALTIPATRKTHSNTLMHIQGYLKNVSNSEEKAALTELIHQYRTGILPLNSPLNLLKQHFMQHPDTMDYILEQVYLNPHPLVIDSAT